MHNRGQGEYEEVESGETDKLTSENLGEISDSKPISHFPSWFSGFFPAHFPLRGFFAAFCYGTTSILIVFFNKIVLSSYDFARPNMLSLFQFIMTVFGLEIGRFFGANVPKFHFETAKKCLPVACWSLINVLAGLVATELLNVPMLSVLRRTSTLFVIAADYMFLQKPVNFVDIYALIWWMTGAIIAGYADLYFSFWGYTAVMINSIATAGFYVSANRVSASEKLDSTAQLYYNSLLCIVPQMIMLGISGELRNLEKFPYWMDAGFWFFMFGTMGLAAVLNYFIFLCSQLCGPTATSITGQLKTVLQSFLGVVFFSVTLSFAGWIGLYLSTIGAIYYCYRKIYPAQEQQQSMIV